MARFRGTVQGNRGQASRVGHTLTGLTTTCNGWDLGSTCFIKDVDGRDEITITVTHGNGDGNQLELGVFYIDEDGNIKKK